jgi:hypothetical protein
MTSIGVELSIALAMSITSAAGGSGADGSRGLPSRGANCPVVSLMLRPNAYAHSVM